MNYLPAHHSASSTYIYASNAGKVPFRQAGGQKIVHVSVMAGTGSDYNGK
jgi:hypothetical protein